jgi:hypothetical protein
MKGSWLTWSLSSIVVLDISSSMDCKKQNEIAIGGQNSKQFLSYMCIEVFKVTDTLIHKIHYTNIKLKPTIEVFKVTDTLIHKIHYTNIKLKPIKSQK